MRQIQAGIQIKLKDGEKIAEYLVLDALATVIARGTNESTGTVSRLQFRKDDPFRDVANYSPDPLLLTLGPGGGRLWWFLNGPIHHSNPVGVSPCRCSNAYPHRRNYAGEYRFGADHRMVMFESRTEFVCLMEVDQGGAVDDIAAQPFGLVFYDGTRHYLYFAAQLHGRTLAIDVKPAEFATRVAFVHAAALMEKACSTHGWQYRVMHGCRCWQAENLEWMRRTYDSAKLFPFRGGLSPETHTKKWRVHCNPYDPFVVWVKDPRDGSWIECIWTKAGATTDPLRAAVRRQSRRIAEGDGSARGGGR